MFRLLERGHTSEELAANAVAKIINIADSADPVLRQQAEMFRAECFMSLLCFESRY